MCVCVSAAPNGTFIALACLPSSDFASVRAIYHLFFHYTSRYARAYVVDMLARRAAKYFFSGGFLLLECLLAGGGYNIE